MIYLWFGDINFKGHKDELFALAFRMLLKNFFEK
jgi:hypothetical protein